MSKNFKYLDDLIHSGLKEIVLDSDIIADDNECYNPKTRIKLDVDDLVIDGNGHTVDAREKTLMFKCFGKNITIKNLILKNSFNCAIENFEGEMTIVDSIFINNLGYGGAIRNRQGKLTIINSKFKYNSARRRGGAIFNQKGDVCIINSLFEKNDAYHWGGAIRNEGKLNIKESAFLDNYADRTGGAISNLGELNIIGSTFIGNADKNAEAISSYEKNSCTLKDCTFKDNKTTSEYNRGI